MKGIESMCSFNTYDMIKKATLAFKKEKKLQAESKFLF